MENMTAKVSCFARAYHFKNGKKWIFKDEVAGEILGDDYQTIAKHMTQGISFFAPEFQGTKEDALRLIVNQQLAPSVLARSAFCKQKLDNEQRLGCEQYLIFAAGYDTFAFASDVSNLTVFHLDLPEMIVDREERAKKAGLSYQTKAVDIPCDLAKDDWQSLLIESGFENSKKTFGSLLGISYYLSKQDFHQLLVQISEMIPKGSAICMDYPCNGMESAKNKELAKAAKEEMKAKYTYEEMEEMLERSGFLIYEHLDAKEMTKQFFAEYNKENESDAMQAPEGVNYLLAVKNK